MGRTKKSLKDLLDEVPEGSAAESGVENVGKSTEKVKVVLVKTSTPVEVVLKSDAEGCELMFEQKDEFLMLDEEVVKQLSRVNRMRYSTARQFHDNWRGQQDVAFAEAFAVDREYVGKASDKLNDIEVRATLKHRWARPDKVADYAGKGYKILSADEAKTYLGAKGSHHEISKNGKTELVLMGLPKEIYAKREAEKVEKNKKLGMAWKSSGVQRLAEQGGRGFAESERDERLKWNDLGQDD